MLIAFGTLLFVSLFGIVALFALKGWEEQTGRVLVPQLRESADRRALRLGDLARAAQVDARDLPQRALDIGRSLAHRSMIAFARAAQSASRQAHALADLVSHKHNFERRTTRSEFLKKVSEFKSGRETLLEEQAGDQ